MTLGIVCAGVLLVADAPGLIARPSSLSARLLFLLTIGLFFGFGATLTGVLYLNSDKS